MSDLRQRVSNEFLPFVRQPGQYIGGEVNSIRRDWDNAEVRIALAFPETYAIGMSHLGCAILYWIANHTEGVACERVFAPWLDAERVMRDRRIPLFTWESRRPVVSADILAFSLQYELTSTNVLNMLDLAGIPIRAEDRLAATPKACAFPLVIAGGPQADNPEPLADFVDLFVIGDGEHAIEAIIEECRGAKRAGASRRDFLEHLAGNYEWAYVPSLYEVGYNADGTIGSFGPKTRKEALGIGHWALGKAPPASSQCPMPDAHSPFAIRHPIRRCTAPDFETVQAPTRPIVPWTRAVHERITIEIMRGCPQGCRFCHAGHTRRPVVFRSVERIMELAEQGWRATGLDEIALVSLSTSDYPHLAELMERMHAAFGLRHVSVSVPSLRVDEQLKHIAPRTARVRKSGLTIAVEAATERMRRVINKKVSDADLMDGVRAAYRAGYRSVKLYFMVGFPGETEEDVRGIFELAHEVSLARKDVEPRQAGEGRGHGPAAVTVSVSPLVPKPHTPFQWTGQREAGYFRWCRDMLRGLARGSPVRVAFHRIERSLLEGAFARGDRRLGRVIELAWRAGARFDGWDECFDYGRWLAAFDQAGLGPAFYSHRDRPFEEILPWDHIQCGHDRAWLEQQARRFLAELGRS